MSVMMRVCNEFILSHQHIFDHVYKGKSISFEVVHAPFIDSLYLILNYRIPSYSFRENYSFLKLEIVENSNSCRKIQFFT